MLMKKKLLPIAVVLAAILSLVFFPNSKGNKPMNETTAANPIVLIETTMGNITIELDMQNAPNSSENFLAYVDDGYFVDTTFHRVIPDFMIQGGGKRISEFHQRVDAGLGLRGIRQGNRGNGHRRCNCPGSYRK
jgi:hypothetical protein